MFRKFCLSLATALVLAPAAVQATSLAVTNAAALNGTNFGLEITLNGTTDNAFVEDQTPSQESIYRATLWIDPNSASLGNFGRFAALLGKDDLNRNVFRLQLQQGSTPGVFRLRLSCLNNAGVWKFARANNGTGSKALIIGDQPVEVTVETVNLGSNQGMCRMTVGATVHVNQGYQASNYNINRLRIGATKGIGAAYSGSVYFDEFSSFRTLAP